MSTVSLIILPYDTSLGNSLVQLLIRELKSGRWTRFAAAVAFARSSANWPAFLDSLSTFVTSGNDLELTFGANVSGAQRGTDLELIRELASRFENTNGKVFLYYEPQRLFHPKLYLFDNQDQDKGLLIVGSSNWTADGFTNNVEANIVVELDLTGDNDRAVFELARHHLEEHWQAKEESPAQQGKASPRTDRAVRVNEASLDALSPLLATASDTVNLSARSIEVENGGDALDPAFARAEALFTGTMLARQNVNLRRRSVEAVPRDRPRALQGQVLIKDVPRGGRRWQQGNMPRDLWANYFHADEGADITLVPVNQDGTLGTPEVRRGGAREVSKNYGIEIGVARGRDYPARGRPIVIYLPVGDRQFHYMLLMPNDPGYKEAEALLDEFNQSSTDVRSAPPIDADVARDRWPESPLWKSASG